MNFHPIANIYPLVKGIAYTQLKNDIDVNGLREPIILHPDGSILDGRNRWIACQELPEVEPTFRTYDGDLSTDALISFVRSYNEKRRNLNKSQIAMVAVRCEELIESERAKAKERQEATHLIDKGVQQKMVTEIMQSPSENGTAAAIIAQTFGTNERYIYYAQTLEGKAPDLATQVFEGDITLIRGMRDYNQRIKIPPPPIEGMYRVWYADPPWKYNDSGIIETGNPDEGNTSDNYGHADRHYPQMTIQELCNLGESHIKEHCEKDAVLFMWTTSPLLEGSFNVIKAWGFKYKTSFVWDKVKHNFGHYNSVRHEFLLVCTKGSCTPDEKKLFDSVQSIERSEEHSEKPEEFRDIIETLYPHGNRIELFARRPVTGWKIWGNDERL